MLDMNGTDTELVESHNKRVEASASGRGISVVKMWMMEGNVKWGYAAGEEKRVVRSTCKRF